MALNRAEVESIAKESANRVCDCELLSSYYVGLLRRAIDIGQASAMQSKFELERLIGLTRQDVERLESECTKQFDEIIPRSIKHDMEYSERLLSEERFSKIENVAREMQDVILENAFTDVASCVCRNLTKGIET